MLDNIKKGFSLVEMLIYIAILLLMLGVIFNITISLINSERAIKALRNIETSALISFERLTREIRQAESVNLSTSILNINPGRLVLVGTDEVGNARTIEFYVSNGVLMLAHNGLDVGALTQGDTRVSSLIFKRFASANSEGIKVELVIESGANTYYRSANFYFSAILR